MSLPTGRQREQWRSGNEAAHCVHAEPSGRTVRFVLHKVVGTAASDVPDSTTTLFFIHGAGGRLEQFRYQEEFFRSKGVCNVVLLEILGHGMSDKPDAWAAYAFDGLYSTVRTLFARLKTARNVLVGHSYGTSFVTHLSLEAKSDVSGVVLLGTSVGAPASSKLPIWLLPATVLEWIRPLFKGGAKKMYHHSADEAMVDHEMAVASTNPMYMFKALVRQLRFPSIDQFAELTQMDIPIVVAAGDCDIFTPPAMADKIGGLSPAVKVHTLAETAHNMMLERPDEVNALIATLLDGL